MTDQETDLLPCPLCGGEADSNLRNTTLESAVGCPCCGVKIEYIGETGRREAIAAWNRRGDLAPMVKGPRDDFESITEEGEDNGT